MFYIVEQDSKLESLQRLSKLGLYVDVVSSNDLYHPKLTSTVAVYVRPLIQNLDTLFQSITTKD